MNDATPPAPPRDLRRLGRARFDKAAREHLMSDLAESLPGAVFQLESDRADNLRYNFVSGRVSEVLGVERQAVLDDPLLPSKLVIAQDSAILFTAYRDSARENRPVNADVRIRKPDGTQRWVRTFATVRKSGDTMLWNGYWNDVTEEREGREQLERSEARLRAIVDTVPGVLFQLRRGEDGSIGLNYLSHGSEQMSGVPHAELIEDFGAFLRVVHEEDRPQIAEALERSVSEMQVQEHVVRVNHRDGSTHWIKNIVAPRRAEDGQVLWEGITVDVTEHKRAEAALIDAENRMREIVGSTPGAMYQVVIGGDGVIRMTYVSEGIVDLVGIDKAAAEEDVGRLYAMVQTTDLPRLKKAIVAAAGQRDALSFDFQFRHAITGELRWLRSRATSTRRSGGEVVCNGFWQDITDIKMLEIDLRAARDAAQVAERRVLDITDSLPGVVFQMVYGTDGSARVAHVSEGMRALTGIERDAAMTDLSELVRNIVDEDRAHVIAETTRMAREAGTLRLEFRLRHVLSGEIRWLLARSAGRRMPDGSVVSNGFWQDITEMKTLEAELRAARDQAQASSQQLRVVTDSLPGVVYQYRVAPNLGGTYTMISDQGPVLFGRAREWITGTPNSLLYLVHKEDQSKLIGAFIEAIRSGGNVEATYRSEVADGRMAWLRTSAKPIPQPDGGVAWSGFTLEVTAEREAQARAEEATRLLMVARDAAQAAEARLRAIFDYNRIGLVMIDEQRQFSEANPSLRELLGIEDEQEFARDFPSFSPPRQPDGRPSMEKAEEVIGLAFERGYNRFDWMHQTRAGELRPCEVALTRIQLGGKTQLFATMIDLRERTRHEAELKAAEAAAHAASKAKGDFLANMSHEIRTPMNAIVGLTHLGLSSSEPDRLKDYLGKIDTAAKSLLQIINDILDFSKIEAGKLSLEATPFDLYGVLDNLSDMLNLRAAEKGLELLFSVEPGLSAQLVGDPLRLGQVLLNLTGNAIKFTDKGQIVVRVETAKRGRDFVRLRFEVADTGIGLSEAQIERLFESFSQADTSTTRRYGGTGLGLAISQRLVDLMDGEITVDSTPGSGSRFSFTARFGLAPASAKRSATPKSLRGMRVLVVDDNATAVSILRAYLESFGFVVESASDGPRAIEKIRAANDGAFRLVLMDWQMPGMNGIEAVRRIRDLAHPEPTVIIMVTAFGREEVERQALSAGLDGFLIKPVNPSVLLDTIVDAFGSEAALEVTKTPAAVVGANTLAGRRVLLVEDNQINQEVARELLQRVGIGVDLAVHGQEAVERAAAVDYDAVLMDVQMPIMDGLEATRRIRALASRRAAVPIIAMTANAMAEDRQRCIEAGMNDHLGKPVDVNRLYALLAKWIQADTVGGTDVPRVPEGSTGAAPHTTSASRLSQGTDAEPDFDFLASIRQMADSHALWQKLARRFLAAPPASKQIAELLHGGELESAKRDAHSLRGVSATLGLLALRRAAAALESRLGEQAASPDVELAVELAGLAQADETARRVIGEYLQNRMEC
ncbi:PAS domain-containing protein [Nevskia ramosa]|uniref:PAS domain-containing protein n=1 Tax=Nevskia ramosa TaxID=64002 RepID=UPI002356A45E|nr:PAS domain-containing protein [Nevskia ramosa]